MTGQNIPAASVEPLLHVCPQCNNWDMVNKSLTPNQIEYLSWRVIAEILKRIHGDLVIADLQPGGGQSDCLSLVSSEPEIVLMLNRNGTSASGGGEVIHGIWERAAIEDAQEAALFILSELMLDVDENSEKRNKSLITTCERIAYWIRSRSKGLGKAQCCWFDGNYGAGPASSLLNQVMVPDSWKAVDAPYRGSDWPALVYAMTLPDKEGVGKVVGLVNMKTGEAINADGSQWIEWTEPMPPLRRIVPTNQHIGGEPKRFLELPQMEPHPDGVAAFRTLKDFDGYKVLGDELAFIAHAIEEQWYEDMSLPTDVDQLKGALFFMSRKMRFVDGYPDEEDVPFLQALVRAIEAGQR
jgi:hypothetical protein